MYKGYIKELARVCAEGRQSAGKSQQWVADQLGVSRSLVSMFERAGNDSAELLLGYMDLGLVSVEKMEEVLHGTI